MPQFARRFERLAVEIAQDYACTDRDRGENPIPQGRILASLFANRYRIQEIVVRVSALGDHIKVLDIGMGYGFYDIILAENYGLAVTGMEIAENIPRYCWLAQRHGITVIPGELSKEPCPIPTASYDVVILAEVIEHLRLSPLRALLEIPGHTSRMASRICASTPWAS